MDPEYVKIKEKQKILDDKVENDSKQLIYIKLRDKMAE